MTNNLEQSRSALRQAIDIYNELGCAEVKKLSVSAETCGCWNCRRMATQTKDWYFGENSSRALTEQEDEAIIMANTLLPYYRPADKDLTQDSSDPVNIIFNAQSIDESSVGKLILGEDSKG